MCTYNITVDELAISKMRPAISRESFGLMLQHYVDELVEELISHSVSLPPHAYTEDELQAIVEQRIKEMEAGTATFVDGEEAFAMIRSRYGL